MRENLSSACIDAMAAVRAIDPGTDHPMRHAVRSLKHEAESVLENAFRTAHGLAILAQSTISDYDRATAERSQQ